MMLFDVPPTLPVWDGNTAFGVTMTPPAKPLIALISFPSWVAKFSAKALRHFSLEILSAKPEWYASYMSYALL